MTEQSSPSPAGMLHGLSSVVAFLSIIPVPSRHASMHGAAGGMHLFPAAGAVIGCIVGLLAWVLFEVAEPLLAGLLAAAALLIITGLHHTDGLADMADGLMARGGGNGYKRGLDAMKDVHTGTGGVVAIVLCVAMLAVILSLAADMDGVRIFAGVMIAEVLAKFSMVVIACAGRPAAGSGGSGSMFAGMMSGARGRRKAAAAAAITIIIIFAVVMVVPAAASALAGNDRGFMEMPLVAPATIAAMLAAAVMTPLALVRVASRSFGGITGDVFGAANDISRIAILAVFISV